MSPRRQRRASVSAPAEHGSRLIQRLLTWLEPADKPLPASGTCAPSSLPACAASDAIVDSSFPLLLPPGIVILILTQGSALWARPVALVAVAARRPERARHPDTEAMPMTPQPTRSWAAARQHRGSSAASRVVLVTGASSGFGRAIAEAAHRGGHRVYGTSRRPDGVDSAVPLLSLDVGSEESAHRCVQEVASREGRLDVLVNNAGVGLSGALEDTSIDEAAAQIDTNLLGVMRMTRAALPVMRSQQSGRIITISSLGGLTGMAYQPVYAASKHAVEGLICSLRLELANSPIDACTVAPGDFRTGFTTSRTTARDAYSAIHADRFARTMATYERDEQNGPDPRLVGDLVTRLIDVPRLRPRYLAGKPSQRAALQAKNLMPAALFEHVTTRLYQLR